MAETSWCTLDDMVPSVFLPVLYVRFRISRLSRRGQISSARTGSRPAGDKRDLRLADRHLYPQRGIWLPPHHGVNLRHLRHCGVGTQPLADLTIRYRLGDDRWRDSMLRMQASRPVFGRASRAKP